MIWLFPAVFLPLCDLYHVNLTSEQLKIIILQLATPEYHNLDTKTTKLTLCLILNMCFTSGMFEICPIFKKGDAMNVCNYRPVSILPIVSKIYEKEMVRQLENYFEDILSPYISGFRKTHSCETVLIRMVEHIKKSLDHGKIVCALLMDPSKAFDCISHKLFIKTK